MSNRDKCHELLKKLGSSSLSEEEAIDFLIAIHIVLETGLHAFFRQISLAGIRKDIDQFTIAQNLDRIGFIEKTTLFIYNSKFNFSSHDEEATRYHKIIESMKAFAEPRNKLLHGHSVSSVVEGSVTRDSETRRIASSNRIEKQTSLFIFIMEGLSFYLDCLDSAFTPSGKESLKIQYLDTNFLKI
jgi:hypothetical protein